MSEDRAHAILSASGSSKWLVCTPSARLEETFPDEESEYAAEGTKCHELLEIMAKYCFYGQGPDPYPIYTEYEDEQGKTHGSTRWADLTTDAGLQEAGFTLEMQDAVRACIAEIRRVTEPLRAEGQPFVVLAERRLDYSQWAPEGFGTGDILVVSKTKIWVFDLKYGKGVTIKSEGNTQMMLYGLGAWSELSFEYEEIEALELCILQPRLNNFSSWSVSLTDLLAWAEGIKPVAQDAWDGKGDFVPGPHCKEGFCRARFTCAARAKANLDAATEEFGDLPASNLLTPEQIAKLLPRLDAIKAWAGELQDYALRKAVDDGVRFPGWKLVAGRSNRFFPDPTAAMARLHEEGLNEEEYLVEQEPKLKGLGDLEQLLGGKKAFEKLLGDLIMKPPGKPTLVPAGDKRDEWRPKTSAEEDFSDE